MLTIYWEVDRSSGSTQVNTNSKEEALAYFNLMFKPFGYKLINIS